MTQGEVDLWDGINLTLYERIVEIFDAARESDPTIPRLTPMALRSYFRQGKKRPKGSGDKGAAGSPCT